MVCQQLKLHRMNLTNQFLQHSEMIRMSFGQAALRKPRTQTNSSSMSYPKYKELQM